MYRDMIRRVNILSGLIVIAIGFTFLIYLPVSLVELIGFSSYSLRIVHGIPVVPIVVILIGISSIATYFIEKMSPEIFFYICTGVIITSSTFGMTPAVGGVYEFPSFSVVKHGLPFGWLVYTYAYNPIFSGSQLGFHGIEIILYFIDVAFWAYITRLFIMNVRRYIRGD